MSASARIIAPTRWAPKKMGWRVTAQNLNLNRDYTKAEAPEMQAMLKLLNEWDPIVYVDMHVTDGAQFQHAISLNFMPNHLSVKTPEMPAGTTALNEVSARLEDQVGNASIARDFFRSFFILNSQRTMNPLRGSKTSFPRRDFPRDTGDSEIELDFWLKPIRGKTIKPASKPHTIRSMNSSRALPWRERLDRAAHAADEAAKSLAGSKLVLRYEAGPKSHTIAFQGYAYKTIKSAVSGMTRLSMTRPRKKSGMCLCSTSSNPVSPSPCPKRDISSRLRMPHGSLGNSHFMEFNSR